MGLGEDHQQQRLGLPCDLSTRLRCLLLTLHLFLCTLHCHTRKWIGMDICFEPRSSELRGHLFPRGSTDCIGQVDWDTQKWGFSLACIFAFLPCSVNDPSFFVSTQSSTYRPNSSDAHDLTMRQGTLVVFLYHALLSWSLPLPKVWKAGVLRQASDDSAYALARLGLCTH